MIGATQVDYFPSWNCIVSPMCTRLKFNDDEKSVWKAKLIFWLLWKLQIIVSMVIQCLNKRLLYDYVYLKHIMLAICSNNVKSCYDQIVLIVAALCLCRLGTHKGYVQSMVTALHGMQHHIRSSYGHSTMLAGLTTVDHTHSQNQTRQG